MHTALSVWLYGVIPHCMLDVCVATATAALKAGRPLMALHCCHYRALHCTPLLRAKRHFFEHTCTQCRFTFKYTLTVVGNPLGIFNLLLIGLALHITMLPKNRATSSLATLSVKLTFLNSITCHLVTT